MRTSFKKVVWMIPVAAGVAAFLWSPGPPRSGLTGNVSGSVAEDRVIEGPLEIALAEGRGTEAGELGRSRAIRFRPVSAADERRLLAGSDVAARRVRFGLEDPGFLDPKSSPLFDEPDGTVIRIELFEDLTLPVVLTATGVTRSGTQLIEGILPGHPGSRFMMTSSDGVASVSVEVSPDDRYLVNSVEPGVYEIVELDPLAAPACLQPMPVFVDRDALAARAERERLGLAPSAGVERSADPIGIAVLDLLIVYTSEVGSNHSLPAIVNKAELAVAEGNSDLERSGARVVLRLVGVEEIEYTETGSNSEALERLRRTSDGYMDDVHELRDSLGADLVCLIQDQRDPSSSGIAYVLTKSGDLFSQNFSFSVVEYEYLTGLNTLVHEVGHNLGCQHDRENAGSEGLFPFSYGYRFQSRNGSTYRTIMAYRPGNRISYFSTPRRSFGSFDEPVGIGEGEPAEADNVTSLNLAAFEVSNYRLAENGADPEARLINVSTRATVGSGERALVGGFVMGEDTDRSVLIRALGPSLNDYGVRDPLPSLKVTLYRDDIALATNSGWKTGLNSGLIADTGYAPRSDLEPALLVQAVSGAYTAVVESADERDGVALVEVYDVGVSGARLVNLSTRGYVGIDEDALIGGFVIGGESGGTKRILVRALGPSLSAFGVEDELYDPAMTLYDETGTVLLENDDWDYGNQQDAIADLGLAPKNRRESAMLLDLPPGLYTVVVRPFENDDGQRPGIGLIEAYEVVEY